jgi:hypothetical protein
MTNPVYPRLAIANLASTNKSLLDTALSARQLERNTSHFWDAKSQTQTAAAKF